MKEKLKKYELVVVYDPSLTDAELDAEETVVRGRLEKFQATEIVTERWGRRELAYMTKKRRSGIYVCYYFSAESEDVNTDLNSILRISDNVLLFQIHKIQTAARKFKGRPNSGRSSDDDSGFEERF